MPDVKAIGIVPARYGATRFPGKPLAMIAGRPLVRHVYERSKLARSLSDVVVATDDERIFRAVEEFGGRAVMTSSEHPTGTDRIAEVAAGLDCDLIVNIQGDEPLMDPALIDSAVEKFSSMPDFRFGSAMTRIESEEDLRNSNVVKVVVGLDNRALYFSRHPIPFKRKDNGGPVYQHIGFYVYKREFVIEYAKMPPTPLECEECLEQLRALENGVRIDMVETRYRGIGVDSPEDIARIERELKGAG